MAMVQSKSLKYRLWATHLVLWFFLAITIFPLLMIIAISFREGNFSGVWWSSKTVHLYRCLN